MLRPPVWYEHQCGFSQAGGAGGTASCFFKLSRVSLAGQGMYRMGAARSQ